VSGGRWRDGWVFSARADALAFGGPVVAAAVVALVAWRTGTLDADLPAWGFLLLVVGCDVAHVWGTAFRAYLDPVVRARRGGLLLLTPLACLSVGVLLHARGPDVFWRALAYVAVFHFVRQPWGFMAYAGRRAGETSRLDRGLDHAAIHAASLHPLLWWHAHLPRSFVWFRPDDFAAGLASEVVDVAGVAAAAIEAAWLARQVFLLATGRGVNRAKALVLLSTLATWYGGIVLLDSDVVFTASNVLAHGVPYLVLVHRYGRARFSGAPGALGRVFARSGAALYVGLLVAVAYVEEACWDGFVWHQHAGWFPLPAVDLPEAALSLVVPLLALPQATHYVLDAFVWRSGSDADLRAALRLDRPAS
jgi:hypothetical protein